MFIPDVPFSRGRSAGPVAALPLCVYLPFNLQETGLHFLSRKKAALPAGKLAVGIALKWLVPVASL